MPTSGNPIHRRARWRVFSYPLLVAIILAVIILYWLIAWLASSRVSTTTPDYQPIPIETPSAQSE